MDTIFFVLGFVFLVASGIVFEKAYQLWKEVKELHAECKKLWEDLQKERRKVNGDDVNEAFGRLQLNQK